MNSNLKDFCKKYVFFKNLYGKVQQGGKKSSL